MATLNVGQLVLPKLFEAQVKQSPNAIALEFQNQTLTYTQLNTRANAVAHHLHSLGIKRNQLVGICFNRSIEMVVALLAVLKAGAAYLPLDPSYPRDRIAYMVTNSAAPILLTEHACATLLPVNKEDAQVILLDQLGADRWQHHGNLDQPINGHDLAYTIYTSGSTGNPKGVAMPHRSLVNLIRWQIEQSTVITGRTLQFSPISFDVSFQEIFSTLTTGGTLVLIADETRRDPHQLLQVLAEQSIERLFLPFVALNQLATTAVEYKTMPLNLKEVITAGEQLRTTPALVQWFTHMPQCSLHNHYGPSESHVVTAHQLEANPENWPLLPPIGKALPHVNLHVLDPNLQPVPAGEMGELYIGGDCLAQGYLHRSDITAERFIEDPFATQSPAYMYKTGDLVRQDLEGTIDFVGRVDSQVKIRGFRVELGGVEAALTSFTHIRAAAAVARPDESGSLQLIGYVVPQTQSKALHRSALFSASSFGSSMAEARSLIAHLRSFLNESLPSYMIPTQFVVMEALPLTPNDKVDRQALPDPEWNTTHPNEQWVAPTTQTEEILATLWSQLLKVKPIGKMDEFVLLGGHSLLATQLMNKIRAVFEVQLSLGALLKCSRLDVMAQLIDRQLQVHQRHVIDTVPPVCRQNVGLEVGDKPDLWADEMIHEEGRFGEFIEFDDGIESPWIEQKMDQYMESNNDQDEILDVSITACDISAGTRSAIQSSTINHIFLTGATGLVGGFLLHELLLHTQAQIHCLVREHNAVDAQSKLEHYLEQCHIPWQTFGDRIHVLPGDLGRPFLGLTRDQFDWLSHHIDVIYHSGAQTNHIYSYQSLRGANVQGTLEVLRLASMGCKLKSVHHLSTLDVLHSPVLGNASVLDEGMTLPPRSTLKTGYARTKWVAERLVQTARDRGIPTHIYRLGMTTGHSVSGYSNPDDMVSRLLCGLVQLQAAPVNPFPLSFTPVDQVAKALVTVSRSLASHAQNTAGPMAARSTFHVAQTATISLQDIVHVLRQQGYPLETVSYDEWMERLYLEADNPMYPFLEDLVDNGAGPSFFKALDLSHVSNDHFCQQLQQQNMAWHRFSADSLQGYITHLMHIGCLPTQAMVVNLS